MAMMRILSTIVLLSSARPYHRPLPLLVSATACFSSQSNNENSHLLNNMPRRPTNAVVPKEGQESVWDYPRPPRLEAVPEQLRVILNNETIADTTNAFRVLETSHPPTYYIPTSDIRMEFLKPVPAKSSYCEWKGSAVYYHVQVGNRVSRNAAWAYPQPTAGFRDIAGYVSFYANHMDACFVGDEPVQPQEGDFYGGWITSKVVGPFKGGAGTWGW